MFEIVSVVEVFFLFYVTFLLEAPREIATLPALTWLFLEKKRESFSPNFLVEIKSNPDLDIRSQYCGGNSANSGNNVHSCLVGHGLSILHLIM